MVLNVLRLVVRRDVQFWTMPKLYSVKFLVRCLEILRPYSPLATSHSNRSEKNLRREPENLPFVKDLLITLTYIC